MPYFVVKYYQRSERISELVESLSQGSPDLKQMSLLLEGPMQPWIGEAAEEVPRLDEPDLRVSSSSRTRASSTSGSGPRPRPGRAPPVPRSMAIGG